MRSIAFSDGRDTIVLTVIDGEGWLWDYATKCADCGAKQLTQDLGAELGIDPAGIVIAATHSHAAPDFIGGWGFVPDWYMQQVTETVRATVRRAVAAMEPAVVEVGEAQARRLNRERRDTYSSAEEQQSGWLRAYVPDPDGPRVIATLGAYAAHPTTVGTNDGVAHPDWVGVVRARPRRPLRRHRPALHDRPREHVAGGRHRGRPGRQHPAGRVRDGPSPTRTSPPPARRGSSPLTNIPLTALGLPGFFDRQFDVVPATVTVGKSDERAVRLDLAGVGRAADLRAAHRRGRRHHDRSRRALQQPDQHVKEKSPARVTMSLSQANDALGYMPQSFEIDPVGRQGLGFVARRRT